MGGVVVVTDSTCDLPALLVEAEGIRVVPLSVTFGLETFISGVTLDSASFYARLATGPQRLPTTAQPAPAWFDEAYADAADAGAEAVVSLHVSSALSGTTSLARDRARHAELPVTVVDTRLVGGALGLAVLAAHQIAATGGTVAEVVAAADRVRDASRSLLVVDSLRHLVRGGRLTGAQAAVGGALQVKPILALEGGRVELRERARTFHRAAARVVASIAEHVGGAPVDVIVTHAEAPDRATALWSALAARLTLADRVEATMGPIVGTHVGPGAVGVAVVPARLRPAVPNRRHPQPGEGPS